MFTQLQKQRADQQRDRTSMTLKVTIKDDHKHYLTITNGKLSAPLRITCHVNCSWKGKAFVVLQTQIEGQMASPANLTDHHCSCRWEEGQDCVCVCVGGGGCECVNLSNPMSVEELVIWKRGCHGTYVNIKTHKYQERQKALSMTF